MRSDRCPEALDAVLLAEAVELSRLSPPSPAAYAVGAVVVGPGPGAPRSVGWSRRDDPLDHAEEVALAAYPGNPAGGTLYTSLEPCSRRRSRRRTCSRKLALREASSSSHDWPSKRRTGLPVVRGFYWLTPLARIE